MCCPSPAKTGLPGAIPPVRRSSIQLAFSLFAEKFPCVSHRVKQTAQLCHLSITIRKIVRFWGFDGAQPAASLKRPILSTLLLLYQGQSGVGGPVKVEKSVSTQLPAGDRLMVRGPCAWNHPRPRPGTAVQRGPPRRPLQRWPRQSRRHSERAPRRTDRPLAEAGFACPHQGARLSRQLLQVAQTGGLNRRPAPAALLQYGG